MSATSREVVPSLVDAKKDLCSEVQAAESMIQNGIETMWAKVTEVLRQRTQEYEAKRTEYEEKKKNLTDQISNTGEKVRDLESHNRKLINDVDTLTKEKLLLQGRLQATMSQLQSKEDYMKGQKEALGIKDKEHESEVGLLQKQIEEQSSMLKEYQEKVTMTTGKMQRLSQQIKTDKSANERIKKSHASELMQQSTENKKLALELSKLKLQISATNRALAISKDNSDKLERQMKSLKDESEHTIASMEKKHLCNVEVLKEKILILQQELEKVKLQHHFELEQLKKHCTEVEKNDFMDARIAFLQHQELIKGKERST